MSTVEIGYFSKAHGLKGQLILKSEADFYYEEVNVLFVEVAGNQVPFFVRSISVSNNGYLVQLEEYDSLEKAQILIGKKVFIEENFQMEEEALDYSGYQIKGKNGELIGVIDSVEDNGAHLIAVLKIEGKEVMLPLAEELIINIDDGDKVMVYDLPEGLLDVYLKEDENLEGEGE